VFTVPQMFFDRESIKANPALAKVKAVTSAVRLGQHRRSPGGAPEAAGPADVNMVRAWHHGEREGMEAEHGSRADATAHKSGGVLDCRGRAAMLARQWDDQVGLTWQRQNFPQWQGRMRTKPAPLADPCRTTGPDTEAELNKRGLMERVSLPLRARGIFPTASPTWR
jgi:hypothetical protein